MSEDELRNEKVLCVEDYRDQWGAIGVGRHLFINGLVFVISKIERNFVALVNVLDGSLKMGQMVDVEDVDDITDEDISSFLLDSTESLFMVLVSTNVESIIDYIKLQQRIDWGNTDDPAVAAMADITEAEQILESCIRSYAKTGTLNKNQPGTSNGQ